MSFDTAKEKLIDLITATTVTPTKRLGLGPKFVHCPTGSRGKLPGARQFWMKANGGAVWGPLTSVTRRYTADVDLFVFYPATMDEDLLDRVIQSDYKTLVDVLLNESQWDPTNSKLINVANGTQFIAPYKLEELDEGDLLVISFPILYRD